MEQLPTAMQVVNLGLASLARPAVKNMRTVTEAGFCNVPAVFRRAMSPIVPLLIRLAVLLLHLQELLGLVRPLMV